MQCWIYCFFNCEVVKLHADPWYKSYHVFEYRSVSVVFEVRFNSNITCIRGGYYPVQVKAAGCPSQSMVWQWPFRRDTAHASTFLVLDPGKAVSPQKLKLLSEACHLPGDLLNTAPDFTWLNVICRLFCRVVPCVSPCPHSSPQPKNMCLFTRFLFKWLVGAG